MTQLIARQTQRLRPTRPSKCSQSLCGVACLVLFVIAWPLAISAQSDPYVAWGDAQIDELRDEMHEDMSTSEVTLERKITYRVVHDGEINARAQMSGGDREIIVNSALLEVIDHLSTMDAVSLMWNKMGCYVAYDQYVSDLANSNTKSLLQGLPATGVSKPFPYMMSHPDICPHVSPDVITNNGRQAGDLRTITIRESIKWVLLHEFAHHLYDDFHSADLKTRRDHETRADNYAFQAMLNVHETPLVAVPVIMLFCTLENFTVEDAKSDHPAGMIRLKAMVEAGKTSPHWQNMWKLATPEQRKQIQAGLDELEKSFH